MSTLHHPNKNNNNLWLNPINLTGGNTLPHRLMQGPMLGVMSQLYFTTVNRLNLVDYWITPFIGLSTASPSLPIFKKKLKCYLESKKPFIVQFLGHNPEVLANSSNTLSQLKNVIGINLNFACPSQTVLSSGSGAQLLTQPERMLTIINTIRKKCNDISISLKLRSGYSSPVELEKFIPVLAESEVDFIILHTRTAAERYKPISGGPERIKKAVNLASHTQTPIIASGDIFSLTKAEKMYNTSLCHGIAVARGMFNDPFLIRKIEAKLSENEIQIHGDSRIIFSRELSRTAYENQNLYNRSNFISLMRSIWGENHEHFRKIINLTDKDIINYFQNSLTC